MVLVIKKPPVQEIERDATVPGSGRPPAVGNGTPLHPIPAFHGQRTRAELQSMGPQRESDITEHTHGLHRCAIFRKFIWVAVCSLDSRDGMGGA